MPLKAPEIGIGAVLVQKFSVRARFDNGAVRHDDDLGGVLDRREAVRDDEGRSTRHQANEGFLDVVFALRVERAGCLVKEQNRSVLQKRPGD